MKKLMTIFVAILLTSCGSSNYYQILKTDYGNGKLQDESIVFEDKNCVVSYNLWDTGGNVGFNIYNKTESDLTINLKKTFFVLNGVAYEYFKNRTFSSSQNVGSTVATYNYPYYSNVASVSDISTSSSGVTYIEQPELTIPPKTSINIKEFLVTNTTYYSSSLKPYPTGKDIGSIKFDELHSPYVFYNLISYTVNKDSLRIENKFYVNEISNYPTDKLKRSEAVSNNFYIKYNRVYSNE